MANVNAPFGFRQLGMAGGSVPATFGMVTMKIASNDSTAAFCGDPMQQLATGYISQSAVSVTNSQTAGILVGVKYFNTALKRVVWNNYWPGSGATGDVDAFVIPLAGTPAISFVVQATSTPFVFADIGATCDIAIGTGNTTTGISGATLDHSTINTSTGTTLPFVITDIWSNYGAPSSQGTDTSSNYDWAVVSFNAYSRDPI